MRTALVMVLAAAIFLAGCTFSQQLGQPSAPAQPSQPAAPGGPSAPAQPAGCTFAGEWSSDWGEMNMVQNGSSVSGTYTFDDGRVTGTVSGKTLTGTWSENADENAYLPPDNAGDVQLNLSDDCNSIEGAWRYGSEGEMSGGWSGERIR